MPKKMNMDAVVSGFQQIKQASAQIENIGWDGLIETALIDTADKNSYAKNDNDESFKELAEQIEVVGLLNPLGVIKSGSRYTLFSGERRFNAITRYLKWDKIPCRVFEGVSANKAQLMLHIANAAREYTPGQKLELYEEYRQLLTDMKENGEISGGLQKNLAELLNVTDRQVRTYKMLSDNLSADDKEAVITGELSLTEAKEKIIQNSRPEATNINRAAEDAVRERQEIAGDEEVNENTWDSLLRRAILLMYSKNKLINLYMLDSITPKEAVHFILHGNETDKITLEDSCSCCKYSKGLRLKFKEEVKDFEAVKIDAAIRQMIRERKFFTIEEAHTALEECW